MKRNILVFQASRFGSSEDCLTISSKFFNTTAFSPGQWVRELERWREEVGANPAAPDAAGEAAIERFRGVRDEAALLGGVGRCGRELCCSTWLPELKPVSLQLAKDQRLSLNPAQISGCCGRLMCCLMYEHQTYVEARRRFPREGKSLKTSLGQEKVVSVDIWGERVTLRDAEGNRRTLMLRALREEVANAGEAGPERGQT